MKFFGIKKHNDKKVLYFFGIKISLKSKGKAKIHFKTFQSLASTIRQNIYKLPTNIDLIVGVPRSGMIPAYIIGLFLNKPVCSLPELLNDILPSNGQRVLDTDGKYKKILVVDDSVASGKAMHKTKELLANKFSPNEKEFMFAAVYTTDESSKLVDYALETVEHPRLFQWNYLNHAIAAKCCFDFDGVLCVDPTAEQNDDGFEYLKFLSSAKPLFIPRYEIHSIVTSRLEKYRPQTESWLAAHNVKYKNLFMLNVNSAEERRRLKCHAAYKASIYKKMKDAICFIESDPLQAQEIARLSGKQCICVSTDEFFEGK